MCKYWGHKLLDLLELVSLKQSWEKERLVIAGSTQHHREMLCGLTCIVPDGGVTPDGKLISLVPLKILLECKQLLGLPLSLG